MPIIIKGCQAGISNNSKKFEITEIFGFFEKFRKSFGFFVMISSKFHSYITVFHGENANLS